MMAEGRMSESLILVVAILALAATVFVGVSIATQRSMWGMMGGGGMMHDETSADPGPGGVEWLVLLASAAFFIASVATIFRGRTSRSRRPASADRGERGCCDRDRAAPGSAGRRAGPLRTDPRETPRRGRAPNVPRDPRARGRGPPEGPRRPRDLFQGEGHAGA